MNSNIRESFLQLVRLGIGHTDATDCIEICDYAALKTLAAKHGLSAVVLDGLNEVRSKSSDARSCSLQEKILLAEWIGEVHQFYEQRHEQYLQAISDLAGFYNSHGFKMMILKGYACSLDWPKPNHRPCGDIDIWLFGQQKEADKVLANTNFTNNTDDALVPKTYSLSNGSRIMIDNSHHHHTVFDWQGFMVENHYDFINVHHHKSHVRLEQILKELGKDDTHYVELNGEKVYLPSPNLHALFLMKHLMLHFSTGEINLRQLLDWGFFVRKHGMDVDWERIEKVYEQFNMKTLYGIINTICVEELCFDASEFHFVHFEPALKQRVFNDIMCPEFSGEMPSSLLPRLVFKYRRWKANEWKHKLCYSDSMWSAFWSGIWSHLMKPKSI